MTKPPRSAAYAPLRVAPAQATSSAPSYSWLAFAVLGSCCMHVGLYVALLFEENAAPPPPPPREMVMEVNTVPPPPPPPPPEVKKAPAPTQKAPPAPKRVPTPQKVAPPPASNQAPSKPAPPAAVHIGLSLSSTSESGSFAAPVGNSMAGEGARKAADPNASKPYTTPPGFVASYDVDEGPEVDVEPDLKAYYPVDAGKQNLEGQVTLSLTINEHGAVTAAKVVHAAGHGFDEAAVRAAKEKLHFKPARAHGQPVSTEVIHKITFLLD